MAKVLSWFTFEELGMAGEPLPCQVCTLQADGIEYSTPVTSHRARWEGGRYVMYFKELRTVMLWKCNQCRS